MQKNRRQAIAFHQAYLSTRITATNARLHVLHQARSTILRWLPPADLGGYQFESVSAALALLRNTLCALTMMMGRSVTYSTMLDAE